MVDDDGIRTFIHALVSSPLYHCATDSVRIMSICGIVYFTFSVNQLIKQVIVISTGKTYGKVLYIFARKITLETYTSSYYIYMYILCK